MKKEDKKVSKPRDVIADLFKGKKGTTRRVRTKEGYKQQIHNGEKWVDVEKEEGVE